jgi:hypothetical protein
MTRLNVKVAKYPPQVIQPGRYKIRAAKGPQETRYGQTLILIVANDRDQQGSLFLPFATEVSEQSNLGRLVKAFGDDSEQWIGKDLDLSIDQTGRRTIEPVVE